MKKNFADLVKIGIVVPTLIISMAACGAASAQGTPADDKAETTEAVEAVENHRVRRACCRGNSGSCGAESL